MLERAITENPNNYDRIFFGPTNGPLPLSINNTFTRQITFEMAMGLVLFTRIHGDFEISMFDSPNNRFNPGTYEYDY